MVSSSGRRFLVIVRAGEKSLHRQWLDGAARNWDLVVSWYGSEPYVAVGDERILNAKGWKWDVLAAQFAAHPELIEKYDYIWIPDDDIETDATSINRMFELAATHQLALCQPALTSNSYFAHLHTLESPSFTLRYTNFVEVMVPCMSRQGLQRVLPYLEQSPTGYGLDNVWARLEDDNWRRSAIIDETPMRHTRPIGVFLMSRAQQAGHDPRAAGQAVRARFGLGRRRRHEFHCYAGISRSGSFRGRASTWLHMLIDLLGHRHRRIDKRSLQSDADYFRFGYRQTPLGRLTALY